jgi:hypothetical protein
VTADEGRRARVREAIGSGVQYGLLFGFAAVAAAISAHGLVGFARANMGLPGPWPYLLWGALDGAAGLCAVLLMRRAARGESAVAPRLAVWGLVAASSLFNWTHAPDHPGAREAFALMPVIAATLFEFSLRETRHTAQHAERILPGLAWLRPVERVRVRMHLAADGKVAAEAAARRVRVESAARRLHVLRHVLAVQQQTAKPGLIAARRVRRAERRAQVALTRVLFADPAVAVEVLRQIQVLTLTQTLARLDYANPGDAHAILASLITRGPPNTSATRAHVGADPMGHQPGPVHKHISLNGKSGPHANGTPVLVGPDSADGLSSRAPPGSGWLPALTAPQRNGRQPGHGDRELIEAATRVVAETQMRGERLSQVGLAQQLRAQGYRIANERLRWLAAASGLESRRERP